MAKSKKKGKGLIIVLLIIVLVGAVAVFKGEDIYTGLIEPKLMEYNYTKAIETLENEDYQKAFELFNRYPEYQDSEKYLMQIRLRLHKEKTYAEAKQLVEDKKYEEAIEKFNSLYDFEDSEEQIKVVYYYWGLELFEQEKYREAAEKFGVSNYEKADELYEVCVEKQLSNVKKGEHLVFGKYLNEGIEFRVLAVEKGKALLVSEYIIDFKQYDKKLNKSHKYAKSDIRKWLINDFYNEAFSDSEKSVIVKDSATGDKVFLLSKNQAKTYFKNNKDRIAKYTKQAALNTKYPAEVYWIQSVSKSDTSASGVCSTGSIFEYGYYATDQNGIRVALWIKI